MVFVKKLGVFPTFLLMQMDQSKVFGEGPERMEVLLDHKNID